MLTKRPDCSNSDGAVKKENKEKRRRRRSSSEKRTVSLIYKTRSLDKEAEELRNQIKELDKKNDADKKVSPKSHSKQNGTSKYPPKEKWIGNEPFPKKERQSSPSLSPIHHCSGSSSSSSSSSGSYSESSNSSSVSITAPDLNSFDNGSPSRKKQRVRRKVVVNSELRAEVKQSSPKVELNFDSIDPPEEGELSDEHFSRVESKTVYNGDTKKMVIKEERMEGRDTRKVRRNGHRLPTWLRKSIGFNNEVMSLLEKKDLAGLQQIVKENYDNLQLCKEKMELKWAIEKMSRGDPDNENYKLALSHYSDLDSSKHAERLEAAYHKDMRYSDIRKIEDSIKSERTNGLNSISPEPPLPDLRSTIGHPPPAHRSPPLPPSSILAAPYRDRPAVHCRYEERSETVHRREEIIHRGYTNDAHRRGYEARRVYPEAEDRLRRSSYEARAYPAY